MAVNWLKEFGFNPLRLPRRDLRPLDVLLKDRDRAFSSKAGGLDMLLSSPASMPEVTTEEPVGSLAQKLTRKVDGKLGVSILGALFGAGARSKLGTDAALGHAREIEVTYEDVVQDSVPLLALQAWMEDASVSTSRAAMVMLNDDKLAVTTAVLRSARLSVSATGGGGGSLELDVPEITGIVSAHGGVSSSSRNGTTITFEGTEAIAFAFQAYVMRYEGNVTLGLEEVRRPGADFAAAAWTADAEIDLTHDGSLPA